VTGGCKHGKKIFEFRKRREIVKGSDIETGSEGGLFH
jgi:hypothetical protein